MHTVRTVTFPLALWRHAARDVHDDSRMQLDLLLIEDHGAWPAMT